MTETPQPVLQPAEELKQRLNHIGRKIAVISRDPKLTQSQVRDKLQSVEDWLKRLEDWLQPFLSPYTAQQPEPTEEPAPLYEFTGIIRAEEVHSEGKFQGKNITVYATDSTEAADKAERAFGKPPRGHVWFVYFNEMKELHR